MSEPVWSGGDKRGYSWPPFEPGNTKSLKHGAESPRMVEPLAAKFREQASQIAPWASSPAFAGAVASWANAEAQAALLRSYLDEVGMLDETGEERPAARALERVEARLGKLRDQLGLSPQALGKLLASASVVARSTGDEDALVSLQKTGSEILEAHVRGPIAGDVQAGLEAGEEP